MALPASNPATGMIDDHADGHESPVATDHIGWNTDHIPASTPVDEAPDLPEAAADGAAQAADETAEDGSAHPDVSPEVAGAAVDHNAATIDLLTGQPNSALPGLPDAAHEHAGDMIDDHAHDHAFGWF